MLGKSLNSPSCPIKSLTNKNVLNRLSPKKAKSLQSKGIFKSHSMLVVQDSGFYKFPVKDFSFQSHIPSFSKTLTILHVKDFPFISLEISFLSPLTIIRPWLLHKIKDGFILKHTERPFSLSLRHAPNKKFQHPVSHPHRCYPILLGVFCLFSFRNNNF